MFQNRSKKRAKSYNYGYKAQGTKTKGGKEVPNCVKEDEGLEEKRGLWDNIHAKRKRIKAGSGEKMRKPGSDGAPSNDDLKNSQKEDTDIDEQNFMDMTPAQQSAFLAKGARV